MIEHTGYVFMFVAILGAGLIITVIMCGTGDLNK